MNLSRREFLQMMAIASASGFHLTGCDQSTDKSAPNGVKPAKAPTNPYEVPAFGNVSFLHYTDCHAQLLPVYFREPSINLGVAGMTNKPPHLVGDAFLKRFNIQPGSPEANAYTYMDFVDASKKYGKIGGFAHMSTLVKNLRAQRPGALLLDGGDTWQGSATSLWTNAQDMVDAQLKLGVDVMTAHWEMTFGAERVKDIIRIDFDGKIDFVAQNIIDNNWEERVFKPYVLKEINGIPCAIVGQAFPYTPIANPQHMIPGWSFGIRQDELQQAVNEARGKGAQVVIVLSHNGMDVDLKMASLVSGVDAIMGGHTHDAIPEAIEVANSGGGKTLVINSGSNTKFLAVLDFEVKNGRVADYRFKLLPIFANLIEADKEMQTHIDSVRAPYLSKLQKELAVADEVLYRRGNFNGTFDQLICDALIERGDAEIAFSPGFRWGVSVLPGEAITVDHVMTQTAITYPNVTRNPTSGEMIKVILEDVADNLFNDDPYYQQGGDMVRVGGLHYSIDPTKKIGERITNMELNGKPIDPKKDYMVAGWASVQQTPNGDTGTPVYDMVTDYLLDKKTISNLKLNEPKISGVDGNKGRA